MILQQTILFLGVVYSSSRISKIHNVLKPNLQQNKKTLSYKSGATIIRPKLPQEIMTYESYCIDFETGLQRNGAQELKSIQLEKAIGTGSYGVVCPIKNQNNVVKMFKNEVDMMTECTNYSKLLTKCPRALPFKDIGKIQNFQPNCNLQSKFCMIMERCDDLDKKQFYNNVTHIINQFVEIINQLQQAGVSHLDIKTQNLMISNKNVQSEVVLIDYGFVKSHNNQSFLTNPEFGTPAFTSPIAERMNILAHQKIKNFKIPYGQDWISQELKFNDIWSFGMIVLEFVNKNIFNTLVDFIVLDDFEIQENNIQDIQNEVHDLLLRAFESLDNSMTPIDVESIKQFLLATLKVNPDEREKSWNQFTNARQNSSVTYNNQIKLLSNSASSSDISDSTDASNQSTLLRSHELNSSQKITKL